MFTRAWWRPQGESTSGIDNDRSDRKGAMLETRDNERATDTRPGRRTNPVFVDRTGRRRRVALLAGAALAAGLIAWLGLLLAGLFTAGPLPIPGWPEGGSRADQAGAEADLPSPTPVRAPVTVRTAGPSSATAPAVAPSGRVPGNPAAGASDRPGVGDEHRGTPRARPSKSPGKPS